MVYKAVGLFHLSLPDSPVVSTSIYVLSAAYNPVSHKEHTHVISYVRVTSLVHETIYTRSIQSSYVPIVYGLVSLK